MCIISVGVRHRLRAENSKFGSSEWTTVENGVSLA